MAKHINLATPECGVTDGMELSFRAPCNCSDVTGITLDGQNYALVDASGGSLTSCSGYFTKGATLTVILDIENKKATLLNPNVNTYTKSLGSSSDTASATGTTVWARVKQIETDMNSKSNNGHKHTKSDITDFPSSMPASDVYTWAKQASKPTYTTDEVGAAPKTHNHNASDINTGTLSADRLPTIPTSKGGTGATDVATARTNLGLATAYDATLGYDKSKGTIEERLTSLGFREGSISRIVYSTYGAVATVNTFRRIGNIVYGELEIDYGGCTKDNGGATMTDGLGAIAFTRTDYDSPVFPITSAIPNGLGPRTTVSARGFALINPTKTLYATEFKHVEIDVRFTDTGDVDVMNFLYPISLAPSVLASHDEGYVRKVYVSFWYEGSIGTL